jgi:UDP-glucuronate decarboxylase
MLEEFHPIIREDILEVAAAPLPWEQLRGRSVLITGANGFLASYMCLTLLALNDLHTLGIQVLGLVRNEERARSRFGPLLTRGDLKLITQDVTAPLSLELCADILVHAASQASPKYYTVDPVGTISANAVGTYNLLRRAVDIRASRLLFFSSSEVYGHVADGSIMDERNFGSLDPIQVRNCYAESKRAGEALCASFHRQFNLSTCIVRPFHTYGPGMDLADGRVFADFVRNIVEHQDIRMNSEGLARRAFCYLKDATEGFFTVLLKGEPGMAYNIGNPDEEYSIRQLAETLVDIFPERGLKVASADPKSVNKESLSTVMRSKPNIERARSLGWNPSTTVREGFSRTIRSFE